MTICRYFLQGRCRFGDRCRYEHVQSFESSTNNYSNDLNVYRQQTYDHGHNSRYDQYATPKHDSSQSYGRYNDNYNSYRHRSPDSNYSSPDRYNYSNYRYNSSDNYGANSRYSSTNRYSVDNRVNSNNLYVSLEDNIYGYKNQTYSTRNQNVNTNYSKSSSSSNIPFSFKVPDAEISSSRNIPFSFKVPDAEIKDVKFNSKFEGEDQLYADIIKEDAAAWEYGKQWPFTCYCPLPGKSAFPGFTDVSPEEFRYEAYRAKETDSFTSYVAIFKNAVQDVERKRNQLKVTTPPLIDIIRKIRHGENLNLSDSGGFSFQQFGQTATDDMVTDIAPVKESAAAFSFKLESDVDASVKTSASSFSFKLQSETDSKPSVFGKTSSHDADNSEEYTPLEKLTEEEKELFAASVFTIGKIPTKPPPRVLCF